MIFGFGRTREDKEVTEKISEFMSIMRTAAGSDGAENYGLALLLLTDGIRGSTQPSSFIRDALTSDDKLKRLYDKQISRNADYFAALPAENLKRALKIYSFSLSSKSEKARQLASASRDFFVCISNNSDIILSQGGTGLETFDRIMDMRNGRI
jgi:hypothetical protein